MKIFGNRRGGAPAASRKTLIRDPLAVIPLAPQNLEQKRDSRGLLHLRLHVPLKGIRKRVADWLAYDFTRKVELDELGSLYYALADGRRTLRDIAGELAGKGGRSRREWEEHVVRFTRTLMVKNLILLKVTDENRPPGSVGGPRRGGKMSCATLKME